MRKTSFLKSCSTIISPQNRLLFGVFCVFLTTLILSLSYLNARTHTLLSEDAEFVSTQWMRYITQSDLDLKSTFQTGKTSKMLSFYQQAAQFSRVLSFSFYDRKGDRIPFLTPKTYPLRKAQQVQNSPLTLPTNTLSGNTITTVKGSGSEVITPLIIGNEHVGYLWTKIEQSHLHTNLLEGGIVGIFFLILLVFLIVLGIRIYEDVQIRSTHNHMALLATTDRLTGLPNRAEFIAALNDSLSRHMANSLETAVLIVEIDRFMQINDTIGHEGGDHVLKHIAQKLKEVAPGAYLGRLGGDTFGLILSGKHVQPIAVSVSQSILGALSIPLLWQSHKITAVANIGSAIAPHNGTVASTLLRYADIARCAAKMDGSTHIHFFNREMGQKYEDRIALEKTIEAACETGNFEIHYQPIVDLKTYEIRGFEALVRMRDKEGNLVSPSLFIPASERTGSVCVIGRFVLEKACLFAKTWPLHMTLSVNLSPVQFEVGDIVSDINQVVEKTGFPAHRLVIEVTEGLMLADSPSTKKKLEAIQAMGVNVALDDFGAGYSSLSYLWRFPFNKLKIDRSFIQGMLTNQQARGILRTIIAMGRILKLPITAEGIETEEEVLYLKKLRCDLAQGYFFSRPLAESDVPGFIMRAFTQRWGSSTSAAAKSSLSNNGQN